MSQKTIRVRLVQEGRENMTGLLGRHQFENGLSVKEIPIREALMLGACLAVTDEAGVPVHPSTYHYADASVVEAPIVQAERGVDDPNAKVGGHDLTPEGTEPVAPENTAGETITVKVKPEGEDEAVDPEVGGVKEVTVRKYSEAELSEIADKRGIEGLRQIGSPLGVSARSIRDLIEKILEAQANVAG